VDQDLLVLPHPLGYRYHCRSLGPLLGTGHRWPRRNHFWDINISDESTVSIRERGSSG
jgi:hypothetical protein